MEENTNMEQQTQAENTGNETEAEESGGESGKKLFTQEEVNGFVQSRISRMKAQASKEAKAEYEQKMAELQAREMKLVVKEHLSERGMPRELADIITCTDEADIKNKLDALQKIYDSPRMDQESKPTGFIRVGAESRPGAIQGPDPVRKAMGLE